MPGHPSECSACNTTPCRHDWKQTFLRPAPNLKRGVASVWLEEEQKPTPKEADADTETVRNKPSQNPELTSAQHMGAKGVGNDAFFDVGAKGQKLDVGADALSAPSYKE